MLALGKELAAGLDQSDVLGRWMTHHVSELIVRAESAPANELNEASNEAQRAILDLWEHKSSLAMNHRPFYEISSVFHALTRLSKPRNPWDFYDTFQSGQKPTPDETESNALLRTALAIEDTIRDAVREIVVAAATAATDREQQWLQLSEHLDSDADVRKALKLIQQLQYDLQNSEDHDDTTSTIRTGKLLRKAADQLNGAAEMLQGPTENR